MCFEFKLTFIAHIKMRWPYETLLARDAALSTNQHACLSKSVTTFVSGKKEMTSRKFLCALRDVFRARPAQNRARVLWRVATTAAMLMPNRALAWNCKLTS